MVRVNANMCEGKERKKKRGGPKEVILIMILMIFLSKRKYNERVSDFLKHTQKPKEIYIVP